MGDKADIVGDDNDRHAVVEFLEESKDILLHPQVHVSRRLVEDEDLRFTGDRPGDEHPLQLPAGEVAETAFPQLADSRPLHGRDGGQPVFPTVHPHEAGLAETSDEDGFLDTDREVPGEGGGLGNVPYFPPPFAGGPAEDSYFPRVGVQKAENDLEEGALPSPVGTDEAEHFPPLDTEGDILEDRRAVVGERDVLNDNDLVFSHRIASAKRAARDLRLAM